MDFQNPPFLAGFVLEMKKSQEEILRKARSLGYFHGPGVLTPTSDPPEIGGTMDVVGNQVIVRVWKLTQSVQRASDTEIDVCSEGR